MYLTSNKPKKFNCFKFKSTTLLCDIENFHNVRHQKLPQIMRRPKHKIEHGTSDKKFLTPLPIRICPHFDELKKGDFLWIGLPGKTGNGIV